MKRVSRSLAKAPLALIFLVLATPLWAQEISYDRYAPVWREGPLEEKPSRAEEALAAWSRHFLVYPFEIIRWPADKTLIFIEKYHIDDKVDWIYEKLQDRGITPKLTGLGGGSFGGGVEVELMKLTGFREHFPNFSLDGSAYWTVDEIEEYRAKVLQEEILGTGLRVGGNFKYEDRGEEHFYGIGPDTSLGDGTSYEMERTTLEAVVGYDLLDTFDIEGKFAYQHVNIGEGDDEGRGQIFPIFVGSGRQQVPGLEGDQILSWALALEHDNRDNKEIPSQGGYERFHFGYYKGIESSTGYFKYRGEAAHFFKLFSERRVLALRGVVEHNDEVGDRNVPFFNMARLGGYGTFPRYGDTHRGFERDRFYDESLMLFNVEYRWTAWEYREWRMDPALFMDWGQVFGEWSDFQFKDFRPSYGFAFRFSFEKEMVLTVEAAKSNGEGTQFYVKAKTPF